MKQAGVVRGSDANGASLAILKSASSKLCDFPKSIGDYTKVVDIDQIA
jgi:hypothetical protein